MEFDGFTRVVLENEGAQALVFRARREEDGEPVVLKALRGPFPSALEVERFRREAVITEHVQGHGVIRLWEVRNHQDKAFLVLEDFQAISLADSLAQGALDLDLALTLAMDVVTALGGVHERLVVHKDVNPSNLVWNPDTHVIKLIDFGISSMVSRERPVLASPNVLRGTLPYLSPEQTGRMNRNVDYRSDYYSLGVTLFEMVVGRLPFVSDDPLELVHAHVARTPPHPLSLRSDLPTSVAAVLLKLLAKTAEKRYQSAYGIYRDLERCRETVREGQLSRIFRLGLDDRPARVQIPGRLYGRKREVRALAGALKRAAHGGREVLVVRGYAGVGKTSVVNEVHRLMVDTGGIFLSGKCEQFRRASPYASLAAALGRWVEGIVSLSKDDVALWRGRIQNAVRENGQVLIDLIPELGLLLGPQPPPPEVSPPEAEQRLQLLFRRFSRALARAASPLVLFVDDLQWADLATLRLFAVLAQAEELSSLLLVGAWRDNQVDGALSLPRMLAQMKEAEVSLCDLALAPLDVADVRHFLRDALYTREEELEELAQLCHRKTGGNPFFLVQFVTLLEKQEVLFFAHQAGTWRWKRASIEALESTDNVVTLMTATIRRLPEAAQRALCAASILGTSFRLSLLAHVAERPLEEVRETLREVREAGLLVQIRDPLTSGERAEDMLVEERILNFAHDRVQQAAYRMLSTEEQAALHLRAGRFLRDTCEELRESELLFVVVQHLNAAEALVQGEERRELVELNLVAGQRARASSAYAVALELLQTALRLLGSDALEREFSLAYSLRLEAAIASYLAQQYDETDRHVDWLLAAVEDPLEQVPPLRVRMSAHVSRNQSKMAIRTGLQALALLGIELPESPEREAVRVAMAQCGALLASVELMAIPQRPLLDDPTRKMAMEVLVALASPAYLVSPLLMALLSTAIVEISVTDGLSEASSYGFALYGLMLCDAGFLTEGVAMGDLAMALTRRFPDARAINVRTSHVVFGFVRHWNEPLHSFLGEYGKLAQEAIEIGDFEYASFAMLVVGLNSFHAGFPLANLEPQLARYTESMRLLRQEAGLSIHGITHQVVLSLRGEADDELALKGRVYDEEAMSAIFQERQNPTGLFVLHLYKGILAFVLGEYAVAREQIALAAETVEAGATSSFHLPVFHTLRALLWLWEYEATGDPEAFAIAQQSRERVNLWAAFNPANLAQKRELLDAEFARAADHPEEALRHYEAAIATAQANGFLHDEANAYLRASAFFAGRGSPVTARAFLMEARYAFQRWGATAVVKRIDRQHPALVQMMAELPSRSLANSQRFTSRNDLDTETVLRASQAIAQEIELGGLLRLLVKLALESSGARKAVLLLNEGDDFGVAAVGQVEAEGLLTMEVMNEPVSLAQPTWVPPQVIANVQRTHQVLLLADACKEKDFRQDPYVAQHTVLSVLALPVVHQGKMNAILYLENEQTAGVFRKDRLALAWVLLGQAAIAIENAQLFAQLENKVAERTQALQEALAQVQAQHKELQETQAQLVHSEKMAALGTLVAGLAHEINNPSNFMFQGASNLRKRLASLQAALMGMSEEGEEVRDLLDEEFQPLFLSVDSVVSGVQRVQEIIQGLRSFSRLDEAELETLPVVELLETIVAHVRISFPEVTFRCQWDADVALPCWPAELSQALLGILVNACQAIRSRQTNGGTLLPGVVTLRTFCEGERLAIVCTDNGVGMDETVLPHIFEPFFTTRSVGEGRGLGLSIAYGTIQKHKGEITVSSTPGQGSTVTVWLPLGPKPAI